MKVLGTFFCFFQLYDLVSLLITTTFQVDKLLFFVVIVVFMF